MNTYEQVVNIVFRLLNFVAIISLAVYVFKAYVLDLVKQQMADQEATERGMQLQRDAMARRQEEITGEIDQDAQLCMELKQRVDRWRRVIDTQQAQQKKEQEKCMQRLQQALQKKVERLVYNRVLKKVMPRALADARAQLGEKYCDAQQGRLFTNAIIAHLERRGS